jgi:hypothetical protein
MPEVTRLLTVPGVAATAARNGHANGAKKEARVRV